MQCPQCQSPIDTDPAAGAPSQCPQCGASVTSAVGAPAGASVSRGSKSGPLLVVALVAIGVGATLAALYMFQQRTLAEEKLARAQQDLAQASAGVDQCTNALLTNVKLKQSESIRKELLRPSLEYYQKYVQAHANDDNYLRELTTAQYRIAAVQAKMGSKSALSSLAGGFSYLNRFRKAEPDAQTFPSLQESALKLVPPVDWVPVREASSMTQADGIGLFVSFITGIGTFDALAREHPEVVGIRDDLAGLHRVMATLSSSFAAVTSNATFRQRSLAAWLQTRDVLETLVHDEPANVDFKNRLVEALVAAGKIQKGDGARDDAIANYTRAVELRQQLAAAAPDDEAVQKELATVQRELEKLKAAPVAAQAAPAAAPAAKAEDSPATGAPAVEK